MSAECQPPVVRWTAREVAAQELGLVGDHCWVARAVVEAHVVGRVAADLGERASELRRFVRRGRGRDDVLVADLDEERDADTLRPCGSAG